MTRFRPCIDLHNGQVKQIVGGSLTTSEAELQTNFVAEHTASWYAERYRADQCTGGHVIMLGRVTKRPPRKPWRRGLAACNLVAALRSTMLSNGWMLVRAKWL